MSELSQELWEAEHRIGELHSQLQTRTLQWEGVKDMLASANERIAALESLLKERDKGGHESDCEITLGNDYKPPCTCGHNDVAKYFAEKGDE